VYGSLDFSKRANVITMNIICDNEVMQHSFLSLILTDAFGIQLRSGCFCAGPFGMQLLKVDEETADRLSSIVSVGILKEKPGYLRLDLTFYLEHFEI
jgi:selenocysteine lyase/cysteine desulfurase